MGLTFTNEPRTSPTDSASLLSKRRAVIEELETFLSTNDLGLSNDTSVTFSHQGISSLVCFINDDYKSIVLKVSTGSIEGEPTFLKAWESVGVSVPHVLKEGFIANMPYLVMERVNAKVLTDVYSGADLIENRMFIQMGQSLAQMHRAKAHGYGRMRSGEVDLATFEDWIGGKYVSTKREYARNKLMYSGKRWVDPSHAFSLFTSYSKGNPATVYCHNDFSVGNIFATDPLTIFDPSPMFGHAYLDLGRAMVLTGIVDVDVKEASSQLAMGYFGGDGYDKEVLNAAVVINAVLKFEFWHQTGRGKRIARMQGYFE